jgi:hypothetical protein
MLGFSRPQPDSGKNGLDWIAGSYMLPILGRSQIIIKGQHLGALKTIIEIEREVMTVTAQIKQFDNSYHNSYQKAYSDQ